jgi:C-terminal processing protease CtpA/Prc
MRRGNVRQTLCPGGGPLRFAVGENHGMRSQSAAAFLLLATLSLGAQTNPAPAKVELVVNPAPVNLDFESGAAGELPSGWISPSVQYGYTAVTSADRPKKGKQCARLSDGLPREDEGFGNLMQKIDAAPYRGKFVRFRAAVRVEGEAATVALWMRVDRPDKQPGFFENMQGRPIRAVDWTYYEIAGDVASDATVLNIGMMLNREGIAWLDDVTVEVLGKTEVRSAPARPVTARGLENLTAFTRLYGIVRHFHASDEAAAADWNAVAVNGAEAVEGAKNASELASRLQEIFLPLAPSARIYVTGAPRPGLVAKPAGAVDVVAWEHTGLGHNPPNAPRDPDEVYWSERVRRSLTTSDPRFPDPQQPFRLDLGGGVSASVPLAVYADASHTLPRASRPARTYPTARYSGNDRASRLGAVVILWNGLQHFYPYFDAVDVDWAAELPTALRAAASDQDEAAFLVTLRRMVAAIDDGHGSVSQQSALRGRSPLPILWRAIGDALVVTAVDPGVTELKPGDEVIAIDGRPVLQVLQETEALISGATPHWRRWIATTRVSVGREGTTAALTVRTPEGSTREVKLLRVEQTELLPEKRPEKIAELKPGLWYVDLDRINDKDFEASLENLAKARGIVFDLRGYPHLSSNPLRHLIDKSAESARWNVPVLRRPNQEGVQWNTEGRWSLEPLAPRFTKNIVFLTDGRAISYAETWMGIVEAYKLGEIVGETTAGTNGNINTIQLPGGYRVVFTNMKVLKHDGSRHHGVGIAPTVPVSPTLAGIRAGRDEQLEKALEVLDR